MGTGIFHLLNHCPDSCNNWTVMEVESLRLEPGTLVWNASIPNDDVITAHPWISYLNWISASCVLWIDPVMILLVTCLCRPGFSCTILIPFVTTVILRVSLILYSSVFALHRIPGWILFVFSLFPSPCQLSGILKLTYVLCFHTVSLDQLSGTVCTII